MMGMGLFAPKATEKTIEEVQVKWLTSASRSISQIYSSGLQYSLANDKFEQCHDLVFCKDFLQDAIHAHLHGGIASIYGFTYNPKTQPTLSLDRLRVLVVNSSDKNFNDKIPGALDFINQFCKKMKLKPSKVYKVSNPPAKYKNGAWIIDNSGMWNNAPPMVSMLTLLLRCGFVHKAGDDAMETIKGLTSGKVKPYQNNDSSYIQSGMKGIENILKFGYRKFFFIEIEKNYPKGADISTMHNSTGIVAFSSGSTKGVCKYWNRRSATDPEYAAKLAEDKAKKEQAEAEKAAAIAAGTWVEPEPVPEKPKPKKKKWLK